MIGFLVPIAFIMHAFWREADEQMQDIQMAQFLKNISLAGGALVIFYAYNQGQDMPLSITDALFDPGRPPMRYPPLARVAGRAAESPRRPGGLNPRPRPRVETTTRPSSARR